MDKQQDPLLGRPLYLYDLPPEILDSLALKPEAGLPGQNDQASADSVPPSGGQSPGPIPNSAGPENVLGSQACSLCGLSFVTVQEQKDHLKTDLHYYNLKQKMHGLKPVSEAEFEKLVEENDVSISGSDTSESEDEEAETARRDTTLSALLRKQASLAEKRAPVDRDEDEEPKKRRRRGTGKPPLLWFSSPKLPDNTYFGIYRAMFTPEELDEEDKIVDAIKQRQLPPISMPKAPKDGDAAPPAYNGKHIFLCMIGGGHFAAMVVCLAPKRSKHGTLGPLNREAIVLAHKTFHRYTTRRKQGGSQSANDNAKGAAHSAGSSLRRYNEQALVDDVRGLLKDWKALIDTSDLLFIRATGTINRRTLFGPYDDQVLRADDRRIRGFPFSTRRATQNELMRSFIELTRLKVKEIHPPSAAAAPPPDEAAKAAKPKQPEPKPARPRLTEEEETALLHTNQIQALVRRSKLPALLSYLSTNNLPASFLFHPPDAQQNHHAPTALHLAAAQNSAALVAGLLARAGADPTLRSREGRTPFELAGDRATRDAFRVARAELGEAAWDWDAARVPGPLSRAEAERRAESEREQERSREEERRRAEVERLRAEGPKVDERPAPGRKRMRLERERRARAAEERIRRMQGGG
ncbi:1d862f8d-a700-4f42-a993-38c3c5d6538e [Thermothielavioides terrestris]|uniref:1d862f8d-a700-4f42-a993-38c3c5d6538e n=1 Tax=Thermothielavioides terrestris TaxID=2587410 RepID=A0A446BAV9_9PEZI|nr:1d862f8d-a700-4f42-a993-38c3c5d6538e [Thermothielavioides terrestris]